MLKCASVYTLEIDNPEIALQEIKTMLEEKITLLKHSIGIVLCHPEFISSGVMSFLGEHLPFDLVGSTTSSQAVNEETGELILTIFVMTSDDVQFRAGVTDALEEDLSAPVNAAWQKVSAEVPDLPKLALLFSPLILKHTGDAYINAWKHVIPDVPVFGMIAIDDTTTFEGVETIYNGKSYRNAMPFVLCYGNINPRFLVGTLPVDKTTLYRGEITKSSGPFVQEINNLKAYQYFENIGFVGKNAASESFFFSPFAIYQKERKDYDGVPVVRGHAAFMEDGTAIFRGDVDEGATFALLRVDADDVLSTTRQIVERINELPDVNGALLFPCIGRRMMTMITSPFAELEMAKKVINPEIPFMIGYAGGEICPTSVKEGVPVNRFHNYSLVILIV